MSVAGLKEGGLYKIQSVKNSMYLNLQGGNDGSLRNGHSIIGYGHQNGSWNDVWKATSSNGLKLNVNRGGNKWVIDEDVGHSKITLYEEHNGANQRWVLKPVAYRITNVQTGRDLRGAGHGKTITTVDRNPADRNTWWVLGQHGSVDLGEAPKAPALVDRVVSDPAPPVIYITDPAPPPIYIYDAPTIIYQDAQGNVIPAPK